MTRTKKTSILESMTFFIRFLKHLYSNHLEQTDEQLSRKPFPSPVMKINPDVNSILDFTFDDFELVGYEFHPHIKAPVAV